MSLKSIIFTYLLILAVCDSARAYEPLFNARMDYRSGNAVSVFCADLDEDSDFDLTVANEQSGDVYILKNLIRSIYGDVNCGDEVTVADVVYSINCLFRGEPPPCQ